MDDKIKTELIGLLRMAEAMTSDTGVLVEEILREGLENPLSAEEIRTLLTKVIDVVRRNAEKRGDAKTADLLSRNAKNLIERAEQVREQLPDDISTTSAINSPAKSNAQSTDPAINGTGLHLQSHNGIDPNAVRPTPIFHGQSVAVMEGFVRTRDIQLWNKNSRLDVHLSQFQKQYGRNPNSKELFEIMKGTIPLPGLDEADQFKIRALAKSISVNGVRRPPIIDVDGKLLDGNRRVTACYYILEDDSGEFTAEEKQRAKWLKVWQLTEHATDEDREAVIVSLNFEPDFKQDWPEYVKAHKVYEQWETLLSLEPHPEPGAKRVKEIRQDIARKFALSTNDVSRYVSMVGLAREFEDYHVVGCSKDKYAVKHRSSDRFQYFDELNKGKNAGGVYWSLNQDDSFKNLVFDLLYDGKFRSWQKIRDLKYVYQNEDAVGVLRKARDEADLEAAQEEVDNAISLARMGRADQRQTGANTKIRIFAKWFLGLPVKAFDPNESGSITKENLIRLGDVLKHVEPYLETNDAE